MLRLTASFGGETRRFPLVEGRSLTLGAARDNDLVVPFPGVSRRHARVEIGPGRAILVDLDSKNGLVADGARHERVVLRPGDRVQAGRAVVSLEWVEPGDVELAVAVDPPSSAAAGAAARAVPAGETAPQWALHLVRDLESLAAGVNEARRTEALARIRDAVGAIGLWTFARVEGDLFLRDCVGPVPSDPEVERIAAAVLEDPDPPARGPVELEGASGWTLISPPLAGATPVLVTLHPRERRPEPWAADLLTHLAERLRILEGELSDEDLPAVVHIFLVQAMARYGKRIRGIGRRALELLQARRWDGRIRELEHAIEGAVLRCPDGEAIEAAHLTAPGASEPVGGPGPGVAPGGDDTLVTTPFLSLRERVQEAEREAVRTALERAGGDRDEAARLLQVSREALDRRIAELGLD